MEFWIARNRDGMLYMYREKPRRCSCYFEFTGAAPVILSDDDLLEVTFENSPKKVELKLVEE